jgi:hypothetical protein
VEFVGPLETETLILSWDLLVLSTVVSLLLLVLIPPPQMLLQWWKHAASTWKATFKIDNYVGAALEW